jgi:hypothetical protein
MARTCISVTGIKCETKISAGARSCWVNSHGLTAQGWRGRGAPDEVDEALARIKQILSVELPTARTQAPPGLTLGGGDGGLALVREVDRRDPQSTQGNAARMRNTAQMSAAAASSWRSVSR